MSGFLKWYQILFQFIQVWSIDTFNISFWDCLGNQANFHNVLLNNNISLNYQEKEKEPSVVLQTSTFYSV